MRKPNARGFSELEFLGLVAIGLFIAALLTHFVFDQSIQVERLNALVHRDGVRLNLESRLTDSNIMKKSVNALPPDPENQALRACVLGDEGNKNCKNKATCCQSRLRRAIPILDFGDERKVIGGTQEVPACLNESGEAILNESACFANSRVVLETVCADGADRCRQASALLVRYQIQFLPEFLKSDAELSVLDRTVSVVIEPSAPPPTPASSLSRTSSTGSKPKSKRQ